MHSPRTLHEVLLLGTLLSSAACDGSGGDSGASLPPLDTAATFREDTGTFPVDTSIGTDTSTDDTPDHRLTLRQEGTWAIASESNSMTGELVVTELLDGDEEAPACAETWSLVGLAAERVCDGCDLSFEIEHTRVETEGSCRGADLPEDGDVRVLGYDGTRIWWDYGDTGVWVPLYDAGEGEDIDTLVFAWETTVAVVVEEEE